MCFHLACSIPGQPAIVAVDLRHSAYLKTGGAIRGDYGGKLHRFGSGWIALGGASLYCALAYETLRDIDAGDFAAVSRCLSLLSITAKAEIESRWPGAPIGSMEQTTFLVASRGAVAAIKANGEVIGGGYDTMLVAYPARFPNRDEAHAAFASRLQSASVWDRVRAIAAEYQTVAAVSESVSPSVEIAVDALYLTGDSAQLANATDGELQARLVSPVASLRVNPFVQILEEHIAA